MFNQGVTQFKIKVMNLKLPFSIDYPMCLYAITFYKVKHLNHVLIVQVRNENKLKATQLIKI